MEAHLSIFPPDAVHLCCSCARVKTVNYCPISQVPKCACIHGTLAHASFLAPVLCWNLHPGFLKPSHWAQTGEKANFKVPEDRPEPCRDSLNNSEETSPSHQRCNTLANASFFRAKCSSAWTHGKNKAPLLLPLLCLLLLLPFHECPLEHKQMWPKMKERLRGFPFFRMERSLHGCNN